MSARNLPLSQKELKELVSYDPVTGEFTSRVARSGVRAGQRIGSLTSCGYRILCIPRVYCLEHRAAWFYMYGEWPTLMVDHVNRVKTDNRLANLRLVSSSENRQNMDLYSSNTSGHRGVHWFKATGKWQAQISHERRKHHLGFFDDIEAAARAYAEAASQIHRFNPSARAQRRASSPSQQ